MAGFLVKTHRGITGNAHWTVKFDDGREASFSIYWNGPGSRLMLGLGQIDKPTGTLVTIDAAGYADPIDNLADADKLARAFLAVA